MACSTITNIDSRIVNNIWLNEKAKGKQWKIAPNSSYVTLGSTRAPKQYEHTRAIIRKVNEISDTPIVMEEEVAAKVVAEMMKIPHLYVLLLKLLPRLNQLTALLPATKSASGTEMSATEWIVLLLRRLPAAGIIPAVEVPEVEHIGSEVEDPNDNAPLEDMDMADVHDSYDAVLADVQEEHVQAAVPELEVTSPAIKNASPTKTAGSGNEFAAEDEGDFDAVEAAESASAAIQSPFASLERLGVEISAVPAEILSFFQEFDRVAISRHRPQHFWIFDSAEVDFYDYSVPRDGVQVLGGYVEEGAADDVVAKVVDAVIPEIIENASNLREIPAMGNSPQDRDCDLGRCETADFYELLLALMGVHHSFIVASVNIVMIGKECMNVVGTIELIAGAIAESDL
uniref:Uncharacterized protein n=1 Tax=Fagus sylvatica TaxID=28930 RepID=A0A2N9HBI2_FAGSY